MIGAGELDRRITILRPGTPVDDGYQTLPGTLEPMATVWARRRDLSDGERNRGNIDSALVVARFVIRHRGDIDRSCAVQHDGLHFQVTAIKELGRREWLELTASAEAK